MLRIDTPHEISNTRFEYEMLYEYASSKCIYIDEYENLHIVIRATTDYEVSKEEDLGLALILAESSRLDQDRQVNTEQQHDRFEEEEGAFELLEIIREGDAYPNDRNFRYKFRKEHQTQDIDPLEMRKLEDAAFALLDTIFDDDEPIDDDILFPAAQLAAKQLARRWLCASQLDRASRESN